MPLVTSDTSRPTYRRTRCRLCQRAIPKAIPSLPISPPPASRLPAHPQSSTPKGADEGWTAPVVVLTTKGERYELSYDAVFHAQRILSAKPQERSQWFHRCCVRFAAPAEAPLSLSSGSKEERGRFLWRLGAALSKKKCSLCRKHGASLCCHFGQSADAAHQGACKVRYHLPCLIHLWTAQRERGAAAAVASSPAAPVIQSMHGRTLTFLCAQHAQSTAQPSPPVSPPAAKAKHSSSARASSSFSASSPRSTLLSPIKAPLVSAIPSVHEAIIADVDREEKSNADDGFSGEEEEEEGDDEEDDDDDPALTSSAELSGSSSRLSQFVQAAQSLLASLHGTVSGHRVGHFSAESYLRELSSAQDRFSERLRCIKVVLCGRNGVGKTFLLNILCFLTCESEEGYRQRWQETRLQLTELEAYWDQEADIVCADLLRVIRDSTVPSHARGGDDPPSVPSTPSSASPTSQRPSSSAAMPASAAVASADPASAARGPRLPARALLELSDVWDGDEQLAAWSRASWLHPSSAAVDPPMAQDGEDDVERRQPSQLAGSGSPCMVVQLTTVGSRELAGKKGEDMSRWEVPLVNATWKPLSGQELEPWLLQSVENGGVTTSHIYRLRHGRVWHACLRYADRPVAQQLAFRYVQLMQDRYLRAIAVEDDDMEYARVRYAELWSAPLADFDWSTYDHPFSQRDLQQMLQADDGLNNRSPAGSLGAGSGDRRRVPSKASDMPLLPSIEQWLSRQVLIQGDGQDLQVDRMFVRAQLRFLCCHHPARFAILLCSVYGPCGILEEVEVWDIPGAEDAGAVNEQLMEYALLRADVPLVLLDREAKANKTVMRKLLDMKVIDRCAMRKQALGHIAFLHTFEKSERTRFSNLATIQRPASSTTSAHKPIDQRDAAVVQGTKVELRRLLFDRTSRVGAAGNSRFAAEHIDRVLHERMTFLCIYPTLFTSLLMRQRATTSSTPVRWAGQMTKSPLGDVDGRGAAEEEKVVREVLDKTKGYELCGLIRHCIPRICQQILQQLIGAQHPFHSTSSSGSAPSDADGDDRNSADDDQDSSSSGDEEDDDDGETEDEDEEAKTLEAAVSQRTLRSSLEQREAADGHVDVEEEKEATGLGRRSPRSPAYSYPGSGAESEAEDEAIPGLTAGSFVSSLASQVHQFAEYHSAVTVESQLRYEQIRETARAYVERNPRGRGNRAEALITENLHTTASQLQKDCRQLLVEALVSYESDYLATEKVEAVQTATAQWLAATQRDNLTIAHVDPKYRGLAQPIQLRRLILDHFFVADHLRVAELHETLRAVVKEVAVRIQRQLFRPALAQLGFHPALLRSQEYRELADRVCALAVDKAVMLEWERLLTEENYYGAKKLTSLSEDRLLLMMKQIAIEQVDRCLKKNYPEWSSLLQVGTRKRSAKDNSEKRSEVEKRRQKVIDDIVKLIPRVITDCLDQLMGDIRKRVSNQLALFFDSRFLPPWGRAKGKGKGKGRSSIFDSALQSFLTQARDYEGKKQPQLKGQYLRLLGRLKRWQLRAQRQVELLSACTATKMGKELLTSIERQWEEAMALIGNDREGDDHQPTLSEDLRLIISDTHGYPERKPTSRRSKLPLKEKPVTAAELQDRWQRALAAPVVSDLNAEVLDINAQLQQSGEKLGIDVHHCRSTDFLVKGKPNDGLVRAVALAWLFGTEVKALKDDAETVWEQVDEVVDFLYAKSRYVLLRRLADSEEPTAFAQRMSDFYRCRDPQALAAALTARALRPSAYLLQLLSSTIRCNLVLWDRHNIARDQEVQLLSPNFHRSAAPKSVVPYLHLAFLACKPPQPLEGSHGQSPSSAASSPAPLVVPLLRTHKSVRTTGQVAVRRYEVEEGASLRRVASPAAANRVAVDARNAFTPAVRIALFPTHTSPPRTEQPHPKRVKLEK